MRKRLFDDAVFVILTGAAAAAIYGADKYYLLILSLTGTAAIAATGLNILLGLSGQISLGHAAFYALGAYSVGILTTSSGIGFWPALLAAGLLSGAAGLLLAIPALRAEGPYLAMITIAFGFVVEQGLVEWKALTGGWDGVSGIDMPQVFGTQVGERGFAYIVLTGLALALFFFRSLKSNALGMAMQAVRDAPAAAQAIGLNTVRIRALAFGISAATAGAAGGLFAAVSSFISPESFPFSQSIAFLLIVMIGGAGAVAGPVYGALIVVFAPEIFSWLAEYRVLAMGVLFLIVLLAAPGGIAGLLDLAIGRIVNLWSGPAGSAGLQRAAKAQPFFTPELRRDLIVKALDVRFGGVHAVKGVSFTARAGEITSLVGPNGAGKSTVVNLICGFNKPQAGSVFLGDREITGLPAHQRARRGVARTFQTAQLFSRLSAGSNVAIAATGGKLAANPLFSRHAYSSSGSEVAALLSFAGYDGPLDLEAGALPHGGRRLTEIARALALRPAILALDEPAAGLDLAAKQRLGEVLRQIAACGVAVLLIEHDMDLVMSVSSHIVVLDAGAKIAEGNPEQIRANPEVKKAYLGEEVKNPKRPSAAKLPEGAPVLTARSLQSGYGANLVLRDVSLEVRRGETVAILGANGAGKTTLLRTLAGLNPVRGGEIAFKDRAIAQLPAEERAQAGLVLVPEGRQVFPELSVIDNLMLGAVHQPKSEARHKAEALLARFPNLQNRRHQRAGLLSGGEQQMLAIARGLIANPDVLMLDEPSLGLAPLAVEAVYEWFGALQDGSLTIVIADQLAPMALALAERAYVLRGGRVVYEGGSERLAADPDLLRAYYLGETAEAPDLVEK
jgi:ABC-type branched-subunit amino acid transport system ATPase component/ABC-type branched-subunit amino acid transport system permease subunit